ncbi:MAG: hypothetical protein A3A51_03945 [Candidatus Levybacteria bacterium RIFCSPLOWO2_01_FULL_39_10]|nr:MAG: hypothetical protein A3A51_03945 [Candidatus Levybacteria bacterium RIFCSPLOWO2_01_FULL_39_10]
MNKTQKIILSIYTISSFLFWLFLFAENVDGCTDESLGCIIGFPAFILFIVLFILGIPTLILFLLWRDKKK